MRILYLINAPGQRLSGAGRCTLTLARHAKASGSKVCIGAPSGSGIHPAAAAEGIPSAVMPMTLGPLASHRLRREVRRFRPDIVHAMSFVPLTLAGLPRRDARRLPRSFVSILVDPASALPMARVHFRSLAKRYRNEIAKRNARNVDAIFAVSNAVKNGLRKLGVEGHVVVARDAFDIADLQKRAATPMQLPGGHPRIGSACAQIVAGKGLGDLVVAFARVARDHPDASLVVAGEPDASLDVMALARKHGVADRVHLIGFLEDTAPFFPALDLYVMPSHSEGLNTSILEAASIGVPVVATNVGGIPEAVIADKTGLLVDAHDPTGLADAMLDLLGDPDRAREMAARAKTRAEAMFDLPRLLATIDGEYERALEKAASTDAQPAGQGQLTRGSLLVVATKLVTIAAAYATNVFLARRLGPDAFGLFGVVVTVLLWLELFVAEGLPLWVARTTETTTLRRALPRYYLMAQLALSAALVAVLLIAAPTLAHVFGAPNSTGLFRLASIDIPIYALYALLLSVLVGTRLYRAQSGSLIVYQFAKLVATVVLVATFGLAVVGAVLGSVTASVAGLIATLALVLVHARDAETNADGQPERAEAREPRVSPSAVPPPDLADTTAVASPNPADSAESQPRPSEVFGGSAASATLLLLQTLLFSASLWLLRATDPGNAAGYFRAASLVSQVPIELAAGFTWVLYAAYAAAYRAGDVARCRHYMTQASRLVITSAVAWGAIVAPTASHVSELIFGAQYRASGPSLAALSVGFSAGLIGLVLGPTLLIRGRSGLLLGISAGLVAVEVVLVALLAPRLGALGAGIASGASLALGGVVLMAFFAPELNFPLGSMLFRTLVPGAIVALVAVFVPMPAPVWLLGWYPVLAMLFVALLWLFKAITPADLDAFREGLA
jgi:glycosyltransferase involved in cell wall biosynthesis/O-antigen/teichoic acid export membrane protein